MIGLLSASISTKGTAITKKTGRKQDFTNYPNSAVTFINSVKNSSKRTTKYYLTHFLKFLGQRFNCNFDEINFSNIQNEDIESYKVHVMNSNRNDAKAFLRIARNYLTYMKIDLSNATFLLRREPDSSKNKIEAVVQFIEYLRNFKKFSKPENYENHIALFIKFLQQEYTKLIITFNFDFGEIEEQQLLNYERYLCNRANKKIITKIYVYSQLRSIQLFFDFLRKKGISDIRYTPPRFLQKNTRRRNDYVEEEEIKEMISIIFRSPTPNDIFLYRNLAIFLIIMDTGCRPIEVSNLNMSDIWRTESSILLKSKKSKRRKVKLHYEIMPYIDDYLKIRHLFHPIDDSLFLQRDGKKLKPKSINSIFRRINKLLFSYSKNPPVAFRHTYITNACESNIDLKKVADIVGHIHLVSTDSYRSKSPLRLKKNTEANDPTLQFEKEFNEGYEI